MNRKENIGKWLIIVACLIFIGYIIKHHMEEQYSYFDRNKYELTTLSRPSNLDCYINKARPYVLSNNGSTADCVVLGLDASPPNWMLPVIDPKNPAYYNQFPSHPLK